MQDPRVLAEPAAKAPEQPKRKPFQAQGPKQGEGRRERGPRPAANSNAAPPPVVQPTFEEPGFVPPSLTGPQLSPLQTSAAEAVEVLSTLADLVYSSRGMPHMMDFARSAVQWAAGEARRLKQNTPTSKQALHGVGDMLRAGVGSGRAGAYTSTRCARVADILSEAPFSHDGAFWKLDASGDVVQANGPKDASSVLDVFAATHPDFDYDKLKGLQRAKTTPLQSIKDPVQLAMRRNLPDFGAAMVLAMLAHAGFEARGQNLPTASLVSTNFVLLTWAENTMGDFRHVLAETDKDIRGECYAPCFSDPEGNLYTPQSYARLVAKVSSVRMKGGMTETAREASGRLYHSDRAAFDAARSEYAALQAKIDSIQEKSLLQCDTILSLIRNGKDGKEWRRRTDEAAKSREASTGRKPSEAAREAMEAGLVDEMAFAVPRFNAESLNVAEAAIKKSLAAAGADGDRVCAAYPGVVWTAVMGPMYLALDFAQTEDDCRMVVIAPKRAGGIGYDLSEARTLLVTEYEQYFSQVADAS
jgi:hypothetical protein